MNSEHVILLVDDEKEVIAALIRILRRENVHILTASNALDGLEILTTNKVALAIVDRNMPGMDGLQFLARMKKINPSSVRVMLTGDQNMKTVQAAINEGEVFRYLSKPWSAEDVIRTVRDGIELYEADIERRAFLRGTIRENVELRNKCLFLQGMDRGILLETPSNS